MKFENDDYIFKLLNDSSKIENHNDLISFLKRMDLDRVEQQISLENIASTSFIAQLAV